METIGWKLLVLLTFGCSFGSSGRHSGTLDYVVSIVLELAKTERGVPNCVFYKENNASYQDGFLGQVWRDSRLEFVTKTVFRRANSSIEKVRLLVEPMVVIVQGGLRSKFARSLLRKFKPSTKVIVTYFYEAGLVSSLMFLTNLSFYNTVYISGFNLSVTVGDIVSSEHLDYRPPPNELFKTTPRRNLAGHPITFITINNSVERFKLLLEWLGEAALFMNTTVLQSYHLCEKGNEVNKTECFYRHFSVEKVDINLYTIRVLPFHDNLFQYLNTNLQFDVGLLVPRFPLSYFQLFTMPFSWEIWTLLLILFMLVEVLHLTWPVVFKNEPILTVICGFERYDLHKAGRWEKMVLLSMIVLTFFAINAYETILISMMTSKPAAKEIRTLADFHESGIKIKSDRQINMLVDQIGCFAKSYDNASEQGLDMAHDMDRKHAYIYRRDLGRNILPRYYDPANRMYRYKCLDLSLGRYPLILITKTRSPLMEAFAYTLNCLIEGGIYHFWDNTLANLIAKGNHLAKFDLAVLYFSDLAPALLAWSIGNVAGGAIFWIEIQYRIHVAATKRFIRLHDDLNRVEIVGSSNLRMFVRIVARKSELTLKFELE
ncbi:conserved hypothetical protein [Culex quinquefasciatus]|uniref:Ionotropic glutamate receptor C-terminal domain-containing protein n=1 Tax=Culex quinquefasciatus TaxID=7176 RepID=B0WLR0_CULQU|nr:conserved hypothetical protein [Culex quinquefasciatus]|eukprot:XP_001849644.1 conserved hypothetical protein [Culex quinquefasciatus]